MPGDCCNDAPAVGDCVWGGAWGGACASCWGLPCVCGAVCAVAAGCWPCCCLCTFCRCHFCDEVWNLVVGFHTTARCTTGAVSRGSRGRCFFTVDGALGRRADAVKETMLRGMVMGGWAESLTLGAGEAASRGGGGTALEGAGALPGQGKIVHSSHSNSES